MSLKQDYQNEENKQLKYQDREVISENRDSNSLVIQQNQSDQTEYEFGQAIDVGQFGSGQLSNQMCECQSERCRALMNFKIFATLIIIIFVGGIISFRYFSPQEKHIKQSNISFQMQKDFQIKKAGAIEINAQNGESTQSTYHSNSEYYQADNDDKKAFQSKHTSQIKLKQQQRKNEQFSSILAGEEDGEQFLEIKDFITKAQQQQALKGKQDAAGREEKQQPNQQHSQQGRVQKVQEKNQAHLLSQRKNNPHNQENVYIMNDELIKTKPKRKRVYPVDLIEDKYIFKKSAEDILARSDLKQKFKKVNTWMGIKQSQYQRAIQLLQVTHNVNFKGEILIDLIQPHRKDKAQRYKLISKLLEQQKAYYERRYRISEYISQQLGFCVIAASYNNAHNNLYQRNLDSIFMQEYQNYHVVYIDDASTDQNGYWVQQYIEENNIPQEKIKIIINEKNTGIMANIYNAAHNYCKLGEIIAIVDGDDALIGRQIFSLLNAVYQQQKVGIVYSNFLVVGMNDRVTNGYSKPIPKIVLKQGRIRQTGLFYTSHLLTYFVDLFRMINKKDFCYDNGTFFDYSADVAVMTPLIQLVGQRIYFLKELTYEYRSDTGINDPTSQQQIVNQIIFSKTPYKELESFPFIENFKVLAINQKMQQQS